MPKIYGERISQEVTGKDGTPLVPRENRLETARWIALILNQANEDLKDKAKEEESMEDE